MENQWNVGDKVAFEVISVDDTPNGLVLSLKYNDNPEASPIYILADDANRL